jgi:hypothetical protein
MKSAMKTSAKNKFPKGWDEKRVRRLIAHYETQTDEQAAAEDDAIFSDSRRTFIEVPRRLVPAVRELISREGGAGRRRKRAG